MDHLLNSIPSLFFKSIYEDTIMQELDWLGTDSMTRYQDNLKNRYDDLKRFGWIDKKVSYKFNSLGFRCDDFDGSPCAMFLGCSNTIGVGIPLEETWAQLVAKSLGLKCANLGIGASSPDTAFRLCLGYIDRLKPKIVIYNQPPESRMEIINGSKLENYILKDLRINSNEIYLKKYVVTKDNSLLNYLKNFFAIKHICAERNIKLAAFDNFMSSDYYDNAPKDYARDLNHYGPLHNLEFSKYVLSKI